MAIWKRAIYVQWPNSISPAELDSTAAPIYTAPLWSSYGLTRGRSLRVFVDEGSNGLDVDFWMCYMRDMAGTWERNHLRIMQHISKLRDHGGENWGALVALANERRTRKCFGPLKVDGQLLWIASLIKECWCILDQPLLVLWRQLCPAAWPNSYCVNELLGRTGIVSGANALDHGANLHINVLWYRCQSRVI